MLENDDPQDQLRDHGDSGLLIDLDGRRAVRFVRRYPYGRGEVWSAITDPDRAARWAFRVQFEPRSGGSLRFDFGQDTATVGTVIVWDEPSILEYEWATDTETLWRIRFQLEDDGDGATLLTFDHLLPDATNPEFAAGWHWHLDRLTTHLAGVEPAQVDTDDHFDDLLARYRTRIPTEL